MYSRKQTLQKNTPHPRDTSKKYSTYLLGWRDVKKCRSNNDNARIRPDHDAKCKIDTHLPELNYFPSWFLGKEMMIIIMHAFGWIFSKKKSCRISDMGWHHCIRHHLNNILGHVLYLNPVPSQSSCLSSRLNNKKSSFLFW